MPEPAVPLPETATYRSRQISPAVLGQRIRAARLAAGLTQSVLAHPYTSAAYISRIEAGQRRPSDLLLGRIARAVHRTVDDLLFESGDETRTELRLRLSRAEWLLGHGATDDSLALAREIAAEATTVGMPELAARAQTVQARCWLANDEPAVAANLLEQLIGEDGQGARSVRTLASLAQAYVRMGAPYRAVKVAENALDLVEQFRLEGLPEALEVSLAEADAHIELGQRTRAADICRRAIEQATLTGQPSGLKDAYWRASQSESERGIFEQAWNHAEGAAVMSEVEIHGDNLRLLQEKLIELSADGS